MTRATSILVVDDDPIAGKIVLGLLRAEGFEDVNYAETAAKAFEMMHQAGFGLVITDVRMQPVDGLQLLRAVRNTPGLMHTKVLMMTAHADTNVVTQALRSGVDGYIMKPFRSASLIQKVDELLGAHC